MRVVPCLVIIGLALAGMSFGVSAIGGDLATPGEKTKEVTPSNVGPQFAVTAFSQEDGFKLSGKAIQRLGIQFAELGTGTHWSVPKEALVRLKNAVGVYRHVDEWIAWVPVTIRNQKGADATIESPDLQAGDAVAVKGTALLRVTEVNLTSDAVDGCAH